MKTKLLLFLLVLTGLDLPAQVPPGRVSPFGINTNRSQRVLGGSGFGRSGQANRPGAPGFPAAPAAAPGNPGNPGNPADVPGAPGAGAPGAGAQPTPPLSSVYNASSAFAAQQEEMTQPGDINFQGVDINDVLNIYAKLVNRTLLRAALPQVQIILRTQTPLTKTETIQALQAVLAMNGVSLVNIGDKFVKVVPSEQAGQSGGAIDQSGSTNIPALGSYITHVVQLHNVKPSEMVQVITPFAKLKDIIPLDGNGILVIRDYAENVKRMLELIEQVDVTVPAEYVSEVIPIRYAKVDDIASALNALGGGGGGATVSIGNSPGSSQISGLANRGGSSFGGSGGIGGMGGQYGGGNGIGGGGFGNGIGGSSGFGGGGGQTRPFGNQSTPNGTPNGANQSFAQRLQNIIGTTGGGGANGNKDQIQLFGQTKIIPNESSSSLLIYATRADMEVIKGIIAKLDVPLAQVLVEAAIIDYSLGPNTFNFGFSAAQNPVQNGQFIGGGGVNNGQSFIQFLSSLTTNGFTTIGSNMLPILGHVISSSNGTNATFGNNLPGGSSYFANIGPNWDVAMNAAQSDSHASVIQRPRIQTSQAKPAQFFVGDTVPYVTGNSYGTAYGSGVSYSQLSVGVELDVTPFINPDGLVVMDIDQEIDDLNGFTTIQNVGQVPNTIKRTLNAEIAVRDKDTVMLGGFIKANKSTSRSGVPFLMDIPILGNLFLQRNDSKQREELIVLMRPTVLPTPELAAKNTLKEEQRLPGVDQTETENAAEERTLIDAERKRELQRYKANHKYEGVFTPHAADSATNGALLDLPVGHPEAAPQALPGANVEEVVPIPQPVHPGGDVVPPPATPPATDNGTVPPAADNTSAPLDSAAMQQKAAAALAEKLSELRSTNSSH